MGIIIGAGVSRPIHPNHLLSLGEFSETKVYNAGDFVIYQNKIYRFTTSHAAGPWDSSEVKQSSSLDIIVSAVGDPRIKPISANNVSEGDMLFYDRLLSCYCIVKKAAIAAVLTDFNRTRYETNYDTYIGTFNGVAHFTARKDAYGDGFYESDTAATGCYYRIEIDNTQAGSITFWSNNGVTGGNIGTETDPVEVTWGQNEAMSDIVAKFTALNKSYNNFAALEDETGVGLNVGGYGENKLHVDQKTACTVIDCSGYAFYFSQNPTLKVGDTFNPSQAHTYLGLGLHHNWRGATASSILTGKNLVGAISSCLGNTGINYSYRTGINFARFKTWASDSGDATFTSDGVGGSSSSAASGKVMKKQTFDNNVAPDAPDDIDNPTSDKGKMYKYYYHLCYDQTGEYAELRQEYETRYGAISNLPSLYEAYLMSHCMKIDANSGVTYSMMNKGDHQTEVKADVANVNYNYKVIPAYPPEYNAKQYGIADSEGFAPGRYYHPEPGDLGLFMRDDIMPLVNANSALAPDYVEGTDKLTNSLYRGSSADYNAHHTWSFYGPNGCLTNDPRYGSHFRCRPSLALPLPN